MGTKIPRTILVDNCIAITISEDKVSKGLFTPISSHVCDQSLDKTPFEFSKKSLTANDFKETLAILQ